MKENFKNIIMNPSKIISFLVVLFFVWIFILSVGWSNDSFSVSDFSEVISFFIFYAVGLVSVLIIIWGGILSLMSLPKGSKIIGKSNFLASCILLAVFIVFIILVLDVFKVIQI